MINIVLADDHTLVRDGIKSLLSKQDDFKVIGEAEDGVQAIELVNELKPDLLIIDIRMPKFTGIEVIKQLKKEKVNVRTIVLSMHDSEDYVLDSIDSGADGYVLKGTNKEEFVKAINFVMSGEKYFCGEISSILLKRLNNKPNKSEVKTSLDSEFNLTKRETQILKQILNGNSNQEIADILKISKRTIEVHRLNLMKKLKVKNIVELTKVANQYHLI
ncbi:MAG: response regulator transcription factor [Flavobacteriales bacterium]|nr:response regulator transcription factor [Flavobacteriales bacterium]